MRSVRGLLVVLAATVVAATPTTASAADAEITPAAAFVRVGDEVTLTTEICPGPDATVTAIRMATQPARSKGLAPFVALDLDGVVVTRTPAGTAFSITAVEAYTELRFQLDCSDGSSAASTDPVRVFPPAPQFWWNYNNYDPVFTATPGFVFSLGAFVMECDDGAAATGTLTPPGATAPLLSQATTVAGGAVVVDFALGADLPSGIYTGTISCEGAGGAVSQSTPVTVVGEGRLPSMGGTPALAAWAGAALLAGSALVAAARRPGAVRRS